MRYIKSPDRGIMDTGASFTLEGSTLADEGIGKPFHEEGH